MNPSHFKARNLIYIFGICLYLSLFFPYFNNQIQEFIRYLEEAGLPELNLLQFIVFNSVAVMWQFMIAFAISGLVTYFFRQLPIAVYMCFPLLLRIIVLIVVMYVLKINYQNLIGEITDDVDYGILIGFIVGGLVATVAGSYYGHTVMSRNVGIDITNNYKFYFYDIPKRQWLGIIISMTVVLNFMCKLTNKMLYSITSDLSSIHYWKESFKLVNFLDSDSAYGVTSLVMKCAGLVMLWALAAGSVSYGIQVIRNKDRPNRKIIISLIFILVPLLILSIPIIRNKTWFY